MNYGCTSVKQKIFPNICENLRNLWEINNDVFTKRFQQKKEKPDLRPAFLIWILKFVMKLRSFCLCFWALLPDGKRAIRFSQTKNIKQYN